MENNELPESEKFSDNPEENLRLENEFLRMKMMAESGAQFGGNSKISPDIENQFLKQVMEFEKAYAVAKPQKVFDILGKPFFENEQHLEDDQFQVSYKKLIDLLNDHNMNVDFIAERDNRFKYDFITKELFDHETDFIPMEGMTTNFIYEEFHPDHKKEIEDITNNFFNDFFERKLDTDTYYISDEIIEPDGNIISKEQLIKNIHTAYEVFFQFENTGFILDNVEYELKEIQNAHSGMGFSEGEVNYDIILKGGETRKIRGPFKIYFIRQWETWSIYFFFLAGVNYHPKN